MMEILTCHLCQTPERPLWSRVPGQPAFILHGREMWVKLFTFFRSSIWSAICARNSSNSMPPSPSVSMCCSRSSTSSSVGNIPDKDLFSFVVGSVVYLGVLEIVVPTDLMRLPSSAPETEPLPWASNFLWCGDKSQCECCQAMVTSTWIPH